VVASAWSTLIEKSIRSDPVPHPPLAASQLMMVSEEALLES
jgi:hypothetical protein